MNIRKKNLRKKAAGNFFCLFLGIVLGVLIFPAMKPIIVQAAQSTGKTVKIGYYQAENFQEGDGETTLRKGYAYEYIQKVSSYTGWKYEYVSGTWEELYQKLLDGEIDLLSGVSYEADRTDRILYPQYEMLKETFYIYVDSQDTSIQSGDVSSYQGKKIGVTENQKMKTALQEWMEKTQADVEVVSYKNLEECAKDFNRGNLDGFVSADNIVSSYSGIAPVEMIGKCPYYLCVSKDRQDLLTDLNEALAIINSQDSLYLDSLRNKYMADSSIGKFLSRQEKEWLDAHQKITVGYLNHYLPYSDTDKNGEATGVLRDILEELFEVLPGDYQPEIIYQSFDNQEKMIEALKQDEIDMVFPVGEETNFSEKNGFQQSSSIMNSAIDLVYTGKYSEKKISRIAVNKNNQLQYYYTIEYFPEAEIIECDSTEECIRKVKKGEASSTVMNALRAVKLVGEDKKLTLLPMADGNRICFGVNFGNSDLLWVLNQGISMLGEEYGTSHSYKYMGDIVAYTTDDFLRSHRELVYGAAILLVLFVAALLVIRYMAMKKQTRLETEHSRKLQKALEKEQEALKKAQQANYAKQIFLNNMSHDIRTPLNGILGIIEINRKSQDPQVLEENRRKAGAAVQQLLTLVNNVIELSKLENGDIKVADESVELVSLMEKIEETTKQRAASAGISFHRETRGEKILWPSVMGKPGYIRETLLHILDNAIKYNVSDGKVLWQDELKKISENEVQYSCTISDTGTGMKPEFLKHIFEEFAQESTDARTIYRGSGLGMPIVKLLIEEMKGTIQIESKPGVGTKVHVMLPFTIAEQEEAGPEKKLPQKSQQEAAKKLYEKGRPDISGRRILLVEDNDLNIEIAQFMLEEAGAKVTVAKDGQLAVKAFTESPEGTFDVILMDLMMPVMNGYDAARAIRRSGRADAETIPVIAMTACVSQEARDLSAEAGMNGFIEKPLDMEQMIEKVSKL